MSKQCVEDYIELYMKMRWRKVLIPQLASWLNWDKKKIYYLMHKMKDWGFVEMLSEKDDGFNYWRLASPKKNGKSISRLRDLKAKLKSNFKKAHKGSFSFASGLPLDRPEYKGFRSYLERRKSGDTAEREYSCPIVMQCLGLVCDTLRWRSWSCKLCPIKKAGLAG